MRRLLAALSVVAAMVIPVGVTAESPSPTAVVPAPPPYTWVRAPEHQPGFDDHGAIVLGAVPAGGYVMVTEPSTGLAASQLMVSPDGLAWDAVPVLDATGAPLDPSSWEPVEALTLGGRAIILGHRLGTPKGDPQIVPVVATIVVSDAADGSWHAYDADLPRHRILGGAASDGTTLSVVAYRPVTAKYRPEMYRTTDGIDWQPVKVTGKTGSAGSISVDGSHIVILGTHPVSLEAQEGWAWTSDDSGESWTSRAMRNGFLFAHGQLARDDSGGYVVAASHDGTAGLARSPDGVTWTTVWSADDAYMTGGVVAVPGGLLAFAGLPGGEWSTMLYSSDGTDWSEDPTTDVANVSGVVPMPDGRILAAGFDTVAGTDGSHSNTTLWIGTPTGS